jgi:hypothetical protein
MMEARAPWSEQSRQLVWKGYCTIVVGMEGMLRSIVRGECSWAWQIEVSDGDGRLSVARAKLRRERARKTLLVGVRRAGDRDGRRRAPRSSIRCPLGAMARSRPA